MVGDGHHNAENIAKTIETIVNDYNFDKNKIKAVVCDEGSALLRLFKQILNLDEDVDDFILEKFCEIDLAPADFDVVDTDFNLEEISNFDNDKEIANEMMEELNPLQAVVSRIDDFEDEQTIVNEKDDFDEYYLMKPSDDILRELELEIGLNKYPRFSCANHKFTICLRKTIKGNKKIFN